MIDLHRRLSIAVCAATCIGAASTRAPPWPEGFSVVTIEGKRMYKVLRAGPTLGKDRKLLGIGILYAATSTDWTALKMAAVDGQVQPDREAEAKARETVDRWLSLLDGGNLERAWETAAPQKAAVEEVVAVLCDDGQWRVSGYHVFRAAKIVVDPRPGR